MTKRELISRIKTSLKEVNADSRLPNKYVYSSAMSKAVDFIQKKGDNLKLMRLQNMFQPYNCVEMDEAPTIDDCCGVRTKCTVMRSRYPIPELYMDSYGYITKSVTTIDGSQRIYMTTPQDVLRAKSDSNARFDKTIYGFFENNHLYITNKKFPKVRILGMFKEDLLLTRPLQCGEDVRPCYRFLDTEWIVPSDLQETIIQLTVQELASIYKKIPEDTNITKTPNA